VQSSRKPVLAGLEMNDRGKVRIEFFYSPTCPYCPAAKEMLREIADSYSGMLSIEEIDAWSESGEPRAERYDVRLVPSIVINGKKCVEGIPNREQMSRAIAEAVGAAEN